MSGHGLGHQPAHKAHVWGGAVRLSPGFPRPGSQQRPGLTHRGLRGVCSDPQLTRLQGNA